MQKKVKMFMTLIFIIIYYYVFLFVVVEEFGQFNGAGCPAKYKTVVASTSWHIGACV